MHIGDEMKINKEREDFEASLAKMKIHNLRVGTIFDTEKNEYFASDVLHPSEDHIVGWINFSWKLWQEKATPEGFVLVPTSKVKYFSNDGENYEIHNTIEEAKKEAESAIEWFSEQLADQQLNPECDGNFHQVGYGIILGESGYSIDHVVTQEDVDKGDYSYEVGTQIMSLFLVEAQEQSHDDSN